MTTELTPSRGNILIPNMVVGRPENLYAGETIQRYHYGARHLSWDGRVFKYSHAGSNVGSMKRAVYGYNRLVAQKTTPSATIASAAVGDIQLTLTVSDGVVGVGRNGIIAKDELIGGYISIYTGNDDRPQRAIVGNEALAVAGTKLIIYIDEPLVAAIKTTTYTEILANPYSDVRTSESTQYGVYCSALGMPNIVAVFDDNYWIQTWGPYRITPTGVPLGAIGHSRQFMFGSNGSILSLAEWHVPEPGQETNRSYQFAGFLLERTAGTGEDAAPFIFLQITPV